MTEVITIRKGDDEQIIIDSITDDDGSEYELKTNDYLVLTVREAPTKDSSVLAEIHSDTTTINLPHSVTKGLSVGKFSADIELFIAQTNGSYKHKTIFPDDEYIEQYGKTGGEKNWKNFVVNAEVGIDA